MKRFLLVLLAWWLLPAAAQTDMSALINDTQRMRQEGGRMTLVWWIPNEYWEASARSDPNVSPLQVRQLLSVVDRYLVIAVIDGEINPVAGVKSRPLAEIVAAIHALPPGGMKLTPLPERQVSADLRTFFQVMKPMLANLLGQVGQGLEFIAFEGRQPDGQRFADPKRDGRFTVVLGANRFEWRLPLGSLLPPAFDPKSGEKFPGNYRYNPHTGERLQPKN